MKKILVLISLLLLLTGCHYSELNNIGIVKILGIDYINNNYEVYVKILENDKNITYTASSNNLNDALNNISYQCSKNIYLSNIDTLLITNELVNNKLKETISYFLNNNEYRNNFNIVLINNIKNYFSNNTDIDINNLINFNHKKNSSISNISFEDFLKLILKTNNTYLPTINYDGNHIKIDGYTLIHNNKIFDKLNNDNSILFNIINNNANNTIYKNIQIYSVDSFIKKNKNNTTININILSNNNDLTILKEDIKKLIIYYQLKNYDLLYKNINNNINIKINNSIKKNYIDGDIYEK